MVKRILYVVRFLIEPSHSNFINELAKRRGTFAVFTRLLLDRMMACKRKPFGRLRTRRKRNCAEATAAKRSTPSSHEWVFHDEWLDSKEEAIRWCVEHEREETTEKERERERNGQRARSEKIAGYIARCSVRDAGCRWRKMRAIVTMAVDTSPPFHSLLSAIYRFCSRFLSSRSVIHTLLHIWELVSRVPFIIDPFRTLYCIIIADLNKYELQFNERINDFSHELELLDIKIKKFR